MGNKTSKPNKKLPKKLKENDENSFQILILGNLLKKIYFTC